MNNRSKMTILAASWLAVAAAVGIGMIAYNLGVTHGLTESGRMVSPPAGTPYVYLWPRPWGFGFGFVFPLMFIALWFFVVRRRLWRGSWGSGGYGNSGVPPMFEEWHRRAHAQSELSSEQKG